MSDDDDLDERLAAISIPEMRRRVNIAVSYLRGQRDALAVHAGMRAENARGPIPELDTDQGLQVFKEIMQMLPLLRKPLSPEQRAERHVVTPQQVEAMHKVYESLTADPEKTQAALDQLGVDFNVETLIQQRDDLVKMDMLADVERELQALMEEMQTYREALRAEIEAMLKKSTSGQGPAN